MAGSDQGRFSFPLSTEPTPRQRSSDQLLAMIALMRIATDVRSDAKRSQNELLIPSASLLMGDLPSMPKDGARVHPEQKRIAAATGSQVFFALY
jgi:hypothetical protein